jgi:threonine/homoserine/homoserine lactone efflux protein
MTDPVLFILAVVSILGVPGPTNTLLATAGAMDGARRSLTLIPAEAAGYLSTILTLGLLLKPMVLSELHLAGILQAAVGAYLLVLALRLWRSGARMPSERRSAISPRQLFVTTLLNPKGIVFALVVIPFGAPRVWPYLIGFVLLCVAASISWITVGAILGRVAGERGWVEMVPRVGAAAIGAISIVLMTGPLRG